MAQERLHKALARAGVASRRQVEKMIEQGLIRVNKQRISQQGVIVDTEKDQVFVDGKNVNIALDTLSERVYFILNKPAGVLSASKEAGDRKTVADLIKGINETRIYPVGRLDYDAEGALILTNDGELTNQLIHPKFKIPKVYEVKIKGMPTEEQINKLRKGIYLEDGPTGPSEIEFLRKAKINTWVKVTLTQGKNKQIKKMFWRIKHSVQKIIRTHFAGISIKALSPGEFRPLTKRELNSLHAQVQKK
ncbi:MAG: rRNA pseudouridine synthase [Deltaproteobacteria bacterium]|nr:rRNA pseudouridine synthase [Deltaproteobacteria bacterium]